MFLILRVVEIVCMSMCCTFSLSMPMRDAMCARDCNLVKWSLIERALLVQERTHPLTAC